MPLNDATFALICFITAQAGEMPYTQYVNEVLLPQAEFYVSKGFNMTTNTEAGAFTCMEVIEKAYPMALELESTGFVTFGSAAA